MALTTLSNVKAKLGITSTDYDDVLQSLVEQVDALILKYLGRNIETAQYTEYPNGRGTRRIRLKQYPATSVSSVRLDYLRQFVADSTLLVNGTDYTLVNGMLLRLNGVWPNARENRWGLLYDATVESIGIIKVVYTAGYDTVPADLTLAADMLVSKLFKISEDGELLASESLEDYSYSRGGSGDAIDGNPLINDVRGLLAPYKRRLI